MDEMEEQIRRRKQEQKSRHVVVDLVGLSEWLGGLESDLGMSRMSRYVRATH
jgi:hypothetical protein